MNNININYKRDLSRTELCGVRVMTLLNLQINYIMKNSKLKKTGGRRGNIAVTSLIYLFV